ncbi:MAG: hypothetical protein KY433_10640 [Actinobacteria bacterium]|nr:hypothetical protein [Actinomycetota bacterium]
MVVLFGECRRVLLDHPAVRDAVVFPVADERWGQMVCAAVVARGDVADRDPRLAATDHDQPPRLHEPDRWRAVRRAQHPLEHVVGHGVRTEAADVAALGDHAVDGLQRVVVVAPAARIGGALCCARGIVPRWRRRPVQARRVAHVSPTRYWGRASWRASAAGGRVRASA